MAPGSLPLRLQQPSITNPLHHHSLWGYSIVCSATMRLGQLYSATVFDTESTKAMRISTLIRLTLAMALLASTEFCQADSDLLDCRESVDAQLWTSPAKPLPGEPFKIMAVTTEGPADSLVIREQNGDSTPIHVTRRGGPPWSLEGEIEAFISSRPVQIEVRRNGETVGCRTLTGPAAPPRWNKATEAFYSAWIENSLMPRPART